MNERIRELWDKAAKSTADDSWDSQTAFVERFSKLLIQDTLDVARAGLEFGDGMESAVERYFEIKL